MNISVVNYGLGNLYSIKNAITSIGFKCNIINTTSEIDVSSRLILPGVGSYDYARRKLDRLGFSDAIQKHVNAEKPILGICLGMQLLFNRSSEGFGSEGFGFIQGEITKFPKKSGYRVPQIQWNTVNNAGEGTLFNNIKNNSFFYFLHSYYANISHDSKYILGLTKYSGTNYISAVEYNNVYGVQFHPEKSGKNGLTLIKNYIEGA